MTWLGLAKWKNNEQSGSVHLPYKSFVNDETIMFNDGSLMTTLHVNGIAFETEDSEYLNHCQEVRETILRSNFDSRFVIYHHVIRRRVNATLDASFDNFFARRLDDLWKTKLSQKRLFVNEMFITIVRRPPRGKIGIIERVQSYFTKNKNDNDVHNSALRELNSVVLGLCAALNQYGVRRIGSHNHNGTKYSELLEFLSVIYNGEMRPVVSPQYDRELSEYLPYKRLSFGVDAMEIKGAGAREFSSIISLKEYPAQTRTGILDDVLRLPYEFVLTESFAPAERQIARERIDLSIRRLRAGDDDTISEKRDLLKAKDSLVNGQIGFGYHHFSIMVKANSLSELEVASAKANAAIADFGGVAVREDINLEPAFWAQFPGNESYIARGALISSENASSLISLHSFSVGQANNNHWGQAVSVFETTSATPYFFNFHQSDLGNFTIIGPSGSGKTVVMNFLCAQAQKYSPRTMIFDKDRGAEIFVRASNGDYSELRQGVNTGFNPLKLSDNASNREFLREWLGIMLSPPEGVLSVGDKAIIARAIDANYEQESHLRNLKNFAELLGGHKRPEEGDLSYRIKKWIDDNQYAWLFADDDDTLDLSNNITGFDMTSILDNPTLRTPTMMYLFHRIDEKLDGEPTIIMIDEGWKALDDDVFSARIRDWMKTLRKRNAIIGFGTQSARDALDSKVASAIVEQTATQIFMPNSRARPEDYCQGFGLSNHELQLIRSLPNHSHCFLIKKSNQSVIARLDLGDMPEILTILSGRETMVRALDNLRKEYGDAPMNWYKQLTGVEYVE